MTTEQQNVLEKYLGSLKLNLIDGGALHGLKYPWNLFASYIHAISFEPQDTGDSNQPMLALAEKEDKNIPFYITKQPDSSSLLKPNEKVVNRYGSKDRFGIVKTNMVSTDTLDNQFRKQHISFVDFMKLDTQGTELSILKGAMQIVEKSVFGIEIEVNFAERYKGQNFFADADTVLRAQGFELFDLERRYAKRVSWLYIGGKKGQLTHGTALYFRTPEASKKIINVFNKPEDKKGYAFHHVLVYVVYGYHDAALDALTEYKDFYTEQEHKQIKDFIQHDTKPVFRLLGKKGSYKLSKLFTKIAQAFEPISTIGTSGDKGLGNRD